MIQTGDRRDNSSGYTNDVNGNITTPTQCETNTRSMVVQALTKLKATGKILLFGSKTPPGVTSAKGLDSSVIDGIMTTIASDTATYGVGKIVNIDSVAYAGVNATSYNATTNPTGDVSGVLHWKESGVNKIATNLATYISPPSPRSGVNRFCLIEAFGFGFGF